MQAKITTTFVKSLTPKEKPYEIFDTELSGFILRIQPSGSMSYYLAYRTVSGKPKRYRIGRADALTVRQARDLAEQYAARVTTGVDIQSEKENVRQAEQEAAFLTLGGFLEHKYASGITTRQKRAEETLHRLRYNFASLLDIPMHHITPWMIEKWRAEQIKRGKARSTINRDVTTLRSALSKAVEWGVLDSHPLDKLKPLRTDKKSNVRFLTEDEELGLRETLQRRDERIKAGRDRGNAWRRERGYAERRSIHHHPYGDHLTPMVLLSLNTGLRRGELFQLRWKDINLRVNPKILTVHGSSAKSGQTRHIPLNTEATEVLQSWGEQSSGTGRVFPGKNGLPLDNVRKSWTKALKDAGVTDFRWHDLRHDFASKLVMHGGPLNTVRELLGHSDLATTLRYAHLAPDHKADAVKLLNPPAPRPLNRHQA